MSRIYNVLFLCTGNSARSIMAEALLNRDGAGRVRAFSAGSKPTGVPHPAALQVLRARGIAIEGLRSKSWSEFAAPDGPPLDFIFTVCGNAAGEACPMWPGRPATAHWGIDDPAAVQGLQQRQAFESAFRHLSDRIAAFLRLPLDQLDDATLRERLSAIGEIDGKERANG